MSRTERPSLLVRPTRVDPDEGRAARWTEAVARAIEHAVDGGALASARIAMGEPSDPGVAEDLVLLLAPDALLAPTALVRLLDALSGGRIAVAPRVIPQIDPGSSEHDEDRSMLVSRDALSAANRVDPETWPSAAVFRMRSDAVPEFGGPPSESLLEELLRASGLEAAADDLGARLTSDSDLRLSVVLRTQVRRPEALRDTLLCLAGQEDDRFEVVVVAHDTPAEEVEALLAEQPAWLRGRSRVVSATGGTRARPLLEGVLASTGSHVAFLDDDDLVASDWTRVFLAGAGHHPRRLIRASAAVRGIEVETWPDGILGHREFGPVTTPYPGAFDVADHIRVNMTPFMSVAFPRRFFDVFGGPDTELEVCEDWDLVLRAARVLGVLDVPRVTAVYRRWSSGGDSYSTHDLAAWDRDMARVREKLDRQPLVLPPGSASDLASLSAARAAVGELEAMKRSMSWRLTAPLRAIRMNRARSGRGGSRRG